MTPNWHPVVLGALVATSFIAGLFFLRFWREVRDRFFAFFTAAFWLLGVNWLGLLVVGAEDEARTYLYVVRLAAFLLILVGIWDKNRR